jgi:hypothetical protein
MTPWEHHPALTSERLVHVAKLIERGRNNALDRYDPSVGGTGWTLGCEAFAFGMHEISQAAGDLPWLEVIASSMQFVFSIGGVPIRFYRGAPEDPTKRTLKQTFSELNQLSLFGPEELISLTPEPLYRIAVETDDDGSVLSMWFVVLGGESPVLMWRIPLEASVARLSPIVPPAEGVELPAPAVTVARANGEDKEKSTG